MKKLIILAFIISIACTMRLTIVKTNSHSIHAYDTNNNDIILYEAKNNFNKTYLLENVERGKHYLILELKNNILNSEDNTIYIVNRKEGNA